MNEQRLEIVFTNALQVVSVPQLQVGTQRVTIYYDAFSLTVEGDYLMYTLPVDHKVQMKVAYEDSAGNPAVVDGPVVWSSSDINVITVSVDAADSSICTVLPVGPLGQAQVVATADADLGAGVRQVITTADIEIVAGEAVIGTINPVGPAEPV